MRKSNYVMPKQKMSTLESGKSGSYTKYREHSVFLGRELQFLWSTSCWWKRWQRRRESRVGEKQIRND